MTLRVVHSCLGRSLVGLTSLQSRSVFISSLRGKKFLHSTRGQFFMREARRSRTGSDAGGIFRSEFTKSLRGDVNHKTKLVLVYVYHDFCYHE